MDTNPEVLIVGAGPTGLVLALWLTHYGVKVRVIDRANEPGTTSRALAVQARTLELYSQLGLADEVLRRGLPFSAINLWVGGERVAGGALGDMGRGISPFPFMLVFPQDEHEKLLIEKLAERGVQVERGVELVSFESQLDRVVAKLRQGEREFVCEAAYLAGCDGARAKTREQLGVGFPGGTYERLFYVADLQLKGPVANHELHLALDESDFLAVFPLKGDGRARLIGTVKRGFDAEQTLTWADVSREPVAHLKIEVEKVNWFSTYRVHHRVADSFRKDRVFLLGDAAHIHSPVGGQGMNTGIADAVNLAWKLAAVLKGRAANSVLDSYEPERIVFANRLVSTTDRIFTVVTRDGAVARKVRTNLAPKLIPMIFDREATRRFVFRTVSQTAIHYRRCPLSEGRAGDVRGGDRLPSIEEADNFAPLRAMDWQLHVYGEVAPELAAAAALRGVPVHAFAWTAAMDEHGLLRNAGYLLRPDGYVGLAGARPDSLGAYLDAHGLRFEGAVPQTQTPAGAAIW